jgi:hypothetical protein
MPISRIVTSAAISLSIAATSLIPLASSAQAGDWHDRDAYRSNGEHAYRYFNPSPRWHRHAQPNRYVYKRHYYRDHDRHDTRNIMIGLTALAVAAIIASAAEREHNH